MLKVAWNERLMWRNERGSSMSSLVWIGVVSKAIRQEHWIHQTRAARVRQRPLTGLAVIGARVDAD